MLDTIHMDIEEASFDDAIRSAGPLLGHFYTGETNRRLPAKAIRLGTRSALLFVRSTVPSPS